MEPASSLGMNSTATLFAYDIVKRYRPKTNDHRLVVVGKITTVAGTLLAIVSSPLFGQKDTIFQALTDLICYIAPPITAVFLLGVFWKRASGKAAYIALVLGNMIGVAVFFLELFKQRSGWDSVNGRGQFKEIVHRSQSPSCCQRNRWWLPVRCPLSNRLTESSVTALQTCDGAGADVLGHWRGRQNHWESRHRTHLRTCGTISRDDERFVGVSPRFGRRQEHSPVAYPVGCDG